MAATPDSPPGATPTTTSSSTQADADRRADIELRRLFDAARDGDARALDTLCRTMRPRLFRAAWSVLRDRDEADDIAQEALVRAVTKRFLFLGSGSVGGWMTRIALNLAKNRRRDHRRRHEIVDAALPVELVARGALADDVARADDAMIARADHARLEAALEALPDRQREVVRLRAIGGLDFRSVAETIGISEENARVTFSQAKKKLVASLQESP
ncbi:MAG TPA: RNA polymerase sigma factor [Myxococcota bacterium]